MKTKTYHGEREDGLMVIITAASEFEARQKHERERDQRDPKSKLLKLWEVRK